MDHDEYGPLPRGVNHIGLTVDDLDQASAFLAKGLGAQWCYDGLTTEDAPRQGPEASASWACQRATGSFDSG